MSHSFLPKWSSVGFFLPLGVASALAIVFFLNITWEKDPHVLPSSQIGKPLPSFSVPDLYSQEPLKTSNFKKGQWNVLNVWASWCPSCRQEHPSLQALALSGIALYGLTMKDVPSDSQAFLKEQGNPFLRVGADFSGRTSISLGVVAVPETYILSPEGKIAAVYRGPLTPDLVKEIEKTILLSQTP